MTPDVEAFLREIETLSEFRAAVARTPKVAADFDTMERGLRALYRVGADDAKMIEVFDAVRRAVARDDLTIKAAACGDPSNSRARSGGAATGQGEGLSPNLRAEMSSVLRG
jgi:hypothetical protein